jgi:hypothetical protein
MLGSFILSVGHLEKSALPRLLAEAD